MDETTLEKLKEIDGIKQFIEFISIYYPGLDPPSYTIEEIEKALFHTYIKLIGKIILISPRNMKIFLKNYLIKYEIMNIKRIILGTILGMSIRDKSLIVNKLVEKYLDNTKFINELIEISSLEEIQLYMKLTKYNRVIREGILYFKNTNEIFVLEAFLDQFYYDHMKKEIKLLAKKERFIISLYLKYISEIYNLNIIYRGIKNNIDKNLLLQFLVDNYLFLDKNKLINLLNLVSIDDFILNLNQYLIKIKEIRPFYLKFNLDKSHLIWSIEKLYLEYFFNKFEVKIDDIDYQAIFKIIEVLIKKDKEIRLYILPRLVEIGHERYKILK
ncbi:MAG: V-type ATPase subunit [Candidatus Lokiarchaeota archaeon]|nr:V-type ATPase subunit [Candidatus Lokiarchaeota archaeon]